MRALSRLGLRLLAVGALACDATQPDTTPDEMFLRIGSYPAVAQAGTPVDLEAQVQYFDGRRLSGLVVDWSIPEDAGSLSANQSTTNASGIATVQWTPQTTPGERVITATVGQKTTQLSVTVGLGPANRVTLSRDSIKLTRSDRPQRVRVRAFDAFNNEYADPWTAVGAEVVFPPVGLAKVSEDPDSLTISADFAAKGISSVVLVRAASNVVVGRIKLVVDIPLPTLELLGPDSVTGMLVGENFTMGYTARDSAGRAFSTSLSNLQVTFSSTNPGVATVDDAGSVIAVGLGTTEIEATRPEGTVGARVDVVTPYDFGALQTLYDIPATQGFVSAMPAQFGTGGASAQVTHIAQINASGSTPINWYSASGEKTVSTTAAEFALLLAGPNDSWYLSRPLTRYDSVGALLWSRPYNGDVAADTTLVVIKPLFESTLRAFSPAGDALWTYTASPPPFGAWLTPSLVLAKTDPALRALNRSGVFQWSIPTTQLVTNVVGDDATVFVAESSVLRAFSTSGTPLWTLADSTNVALGPNNSLLIWRSNGTLQSVDRVTGALRWTSPAPRKRGPLTVFGNKVVLNKGYLHIYDAVTGQYRGRSAATPSTQSPVRCTARGLAFSTATKAQRYAKCE